LVEKISLHCLGDVGKAWKLEEARFVIIVSSTTGDGEQPENVIKFWRKLRPKSLESDHLAHMSYTILGLGDTNYNNFCNAPKALHRRLTELGARTFYPPDWADDGTGLEIVVEPWLENLWEAVDNLTDNSEAVIMDKQADINNELEKVVNKFPEIKLSEGKGYTLPACPKPYLTVEFEDVGDLAEVKRTNLPSQAGDIELGTVISNELLSVNSRDVKDYHNLLLSCDDFQYKVGDTVGVLCRNEAREVEKIRKIIQLDPVLWTKPCRIALRTDSSAKAKAKLPAHLTGDTVTLEEVFSCLVDLRAVPKKLFVRALLEHTNDKMDCELLSLWCSKEGAKDFSVEVTEKKMTIVDLFDRAPSCQPPVAVLLEHLPRLLPRPYSISSCVEETPGQISWLFTRVSDPRPGLATSWMSGLSPGDRISFYPRSGNSFYPPESNDQNYIMVAAGSGIGPFVGFLKDRKIRIQRGEIFNGKCWLFFGCRYKDADNIYKHYIDELIDVGVLTKFNASFSREQSTDLRYVQHSIESEKEAVSDWLINSSSMLYICGDAKGMAADVKKVLQIILSDKLGEDGALAFMKTMQLEKRLKEDIWS